MLAKIGQMMGRAMAEYMDWDAVSMLATVYLDHQCPFCTHVPYVRLGNLRRHYLARHT